MIVRRARTMQDVENMVALGAQMHKETRYARVPYVPAKLLAYGQQFLDDPSTGVYILAENEGRILGMMCGFSLRSFFNDEIVARDMIIYVRPECRVGTTAMRLVREFERWAKENKATEITIGITADIDDAKAIKFYETLGYARRGVTLAKEIGHG